MRSEHQDAFFDRRLGLPEEIRRDLPGAHEKGLKTLEVKVLSDPRLAQDNKVTDKVGTRTVLRTLFPAFQHIEHNSNTTLKVFEADADRFCSTGFAT